LERKDQRLVGKLESEEESQTDITTLEYGYIDYNGFITPCSIVYIPQDW
jgi:hypothetical protein